MTEDEQVEETGGWACGPQRHLLVYFGFCALKSTDGHPGESLTTKDALSRKEGTLETLTRPALHQEVCLQEPQGAARLSWSWRAYLEEETWLAVPWRSRKAEVPTVAEAKTGMRNTLFRDRGWRGQGARFPQGPSGARERLLSRMEPQDFSQEGRGAPRGRGGSPDSAVRKRPCLDVGKQGTDSQTMMLFRQDCLPSLLWKPVYPGEAMAPRTGGQMPAFLSPRPSPHFRESLSWTEELFDQEERGSLDQDGSGIFSVWESECAHDRGGQKSRGTCSSVLRGRKGKRCRRRLKPVVPTCCPDFIRKHLLIWSRKSRWNALWDLEFKA